MPLGLYAAAAILLGLGMGQFSKPNWMHVVIYPALFLMLYPSMLDVDFSGIKRVFVSPGLVTGALLMNFLVAPLLIFGLVCLFAGAGQLHLMVGVILYGLVPGGGMVPAFTAMLKGNVNLTILISAISSILSLGIVPLWTEFLIGARVALSPMLIFQHLCCIILIPLTLAVLTRHIIVRRRGNATFLLAKDRIQALSGLGLGLLLFAMSVLYGDIVMSQPLMIPRIAGPVASFLLILFLLSGLLGRVFSVRHDDAVALTVSTTAKNNAVSLALAYSAFGPDAALVNAIAGPLVQLPILLGFIAFKKRRTTSPPVFGPLKAYWHRDSTTANRS